MFQNCIGSKPKTEPKRGVSLAVFFLFFFACQTFRRVGKKPTRCFPAGRKSSLVGGRRRSRTDHAWRCWRKAEPVKRKQRTRPFSLPVPHRQLRSPSPACGFERTAAKPPHRMMSSVGDEERSAPLRGCRQPQSLSF